MLISICITFLLFFIHFIAVKIPPKGPNPSIISFVIDIFVEF